MELQEYVETRRRRYLAQALGPFDEHVQPLLDELPINAEARAALEDSLDSWKRDLRRSFRNFTNDVTDYLHDVDSPHINGLTAGLRDRVR